jgi:hypothetical protein
MLSPEQRLLAEEISYIPISSQEEADQQIEVPVTYDPSAVPRATQKANDVYKDDNGILRLYWVPMGGNYPEAEKQALTGWYEVPTYGEAEEWLFDNADCLTPNGDAIEPDHPDSWFSLLALI